MIAPNKTNAGKPDKKVKRKPAVLVTREAMETEAAEFVRLKIDHLKVTARMEERKAAIEREYAEELARLSQDMELKFAACMNYCQLHRGELLPTERKSFATVNAVIGFRDTPPAVERTSSKETWESIALRLEGLEFDLGGDRKLCCETYVREGKPTVDKEALLKDRATFTPVQLRAMGLRFSTEEHFYIDPKADIVEATTQEI